ncbi:unnamed protein product [Amoebophrya sp. A120]|nr:unnamed protein product [Amoebophrya sp. A120]|eukprot:GSA120T00008256001.1
MIDPVEVLQVHEATGVSAWYAAEVVDWSDDKLKCAIDADTTVEVDFSCVRLAKDQAASNEAFQPQPGTVCEVLKQGPLKALGWQQCCIKQIRDDFYFVYQGDPANSWIVERSNLRPIQDSSSSGGGSSGLSFQNVSREVIPLEQELSAWVTDGAGDADACLQQVASKVGLLICRGGLNSETSKPEVVMVGEKVALRRGRMLLSTHLKHQKSIQQFHVKREKKMKALDEQRNKYSDKFSHEWVAEGKCAGMIVGKEGKNVKRVRAAHGVEILIDDEEDGSVKVRIYGDTQEQVDKARAELEYVRDEFQVEKNLVGWVLGKRRANLNDIQEQSGIGQCIFDGDRNVVTLIGLKEQVQDAMMLLEAHCTYNDVYQEMDEELAELENELDRGNRGAGRGGTKGKGKRGKDSESSSARPSSSSKSKKGSGKKGERNSRSNYSSAADSPEDGAGEPRQQGRNSNKSVGKKGRNNITVVTRTADVEEYDKKEEDYPSLTEAAMTPSNRKSRGKKKGQNKNDSSGAADVDKKDNDSGTADKTADQPDKDSSATSKQDSSASKVVVAGASNSTATPVVNSGSADDASPGTTMAATPSSSSQKKQRGRRSGGNKDDLVNENDTSSSPAGKGAKNLKAESTNTISTTTEVEA